MTTTKEKKKFQVIPRGDRVLVKELKGENVSKGGIVLPVSNEPHNVVVEVIDVGDDKDIKDITAGDLVIVGHLSDCNKIGDYYMIENYDVIAHYKE